MDSIQDIITRLTRIEDKMDAKLEAVGERLVPIEKHVTAVRTIGKAISWVLAIGSAVATAWFAFLADHK